VGIAPAPLAFATGGSGRGGEGFPTGVSSREARGSEVPARSLPTGDAEGESVRGPSIRRATCRTVRNGGEVPKVKND
jgi:hypothetical protein